MKRKQEKLKFIGLIGIGYWGKNILRNLYELNALHTACELNARAIRKYRKIYPDVNYTKNLKKILENPDIKAVVIATPANSHYKITKESIIAGKDVFVEKPLALNIKEGRELIELAKEKKTILMVGHVIQYHPAFMKLKELISKGVLGNIQYIYSNRLNIGKLRTEENILWSFAPHDISAILALIGDEMVNVSAFGGNYITPGVYDTTITNFEFKNNIKGHIFVSWLHPYKEQKLVITGTKAMVVFDDLSKEKLFLYSHKIRLNHIKIPVVTKANYRIIPVKKDEPLRLELEHFIECVKFRKKPRTDGFEGLRVLKVLEKCEKALRKRGF